MRTAPALNYAALAEGQLADLAREGDREAFRAIMQRCNQRLFRVARGVVRDEAEAEDVLQEAYVRAFRAIGGFRGEAGVFTWLTRIVLNEARGRLRARRPVAPVEEIDTAQVLVFPTRLGGEDPEASAGNADVRRLLERAVDSLPEPFRLVFLMREVDDCSVEETAQALGVKPQTVKTRLYRARRLLRQGLEAELADALTGAYPFLGARCARITEAVLARL